MPTPLTFNANWYLQQHQDIAAAVDAGAPFDALEHFMLYGREEGRSASPLFDTEYYLLNNLDVAEAVAQGVINAWDHFELFGGDEGRSPTPLFNSLFYVQQNPDIAAAIEQGIISSATQHFVLYGHTELRSINPAIDLERYLNVNPDIAEAVSNGGIDALSHLLEYGINEGRDLGNGILLSDFANDPVFTQALVSGNAGQALARVESVAPFMPNYERPEGWTPASDTLIPVDFVLSPGSSLRLVVPSEVVVPENMTLTPVFVQPPIPTPPPPPVPEPTPGNSVSGGGSNTFRVVNDGEGGVSFAGRATGTITIKMGDNDVITFVRQGIEASQTVLLSELGEIRLGAANLTLSAAQLGVLRESGEVTVAGTGTVTVNVTQESAAAFSDTIFGFGFTGNILVNALSGKVDLSQAFINKESKPEFSELRYHVEAGATLTVANLSKLGAEDGIYAVTGEGNLVITALSDDAVDLSTVDVAGNKHLSVSDSLELNPNTLLGNFSVLVNEGATFTLTAAQATALVSLVGEGAAIINGTAAADIMDFSAKTWEVASLTINGGGGIDLLEGPAGFEGELVLNGGTNADTFVISSGEAIIGDFQAEVDELLVSAGATAVMTLQTDTDLSALQAAARIDLQGILRIDLNGFQLNATEGQLAHIVVEDTLTNLLALAQEETAAAKVALTASSVIAKNVGGAREEIRFEGADTVDAATAINFVDNEATLSTSDYEAIVAAGLTSTAGNTITVSGISANDTVDASGQAANFVFVGSSLGSIRSSTIITGGEGTNTLENVGHVNGNWLDGVSGVDTINWSNTNGARDDVKTLNTLVAAGEAVTFNLTAIGSNIEIDGSAETDGAFVIDGSNMDAASQLTAVGGAGNDTIIGGAGDDTLRGGGGVNTLTGGEGNDTFAFAQESAGTGTHAVTDFVSGVDTFSIMLSGSNIDGSTLIKTNGLGGFNWSNYDVGTLVVDHWTDHPTEYLYIFAEAVDNRGWAEGTIRVDIGKNSGVQLSDFSFELTGTEGSDRLVGGDGGNTFIGGSGGDTLIGGAGADVFKYLNALDSIESAMDEIVSFDILNDKINLREALTTQNHIDLVNGGDDFANFDAVLGSVNFQFSNESCLNVYVAGDGTDTWVFVDFVNHGTYDPGQDMVIQLAGISDAASVDSSIFII